MKGWWTGNDVSQSKVKKLCAIHEWKRVSSLSTCRCDIERFCFHLVLKE